MWGCLRIELYLCLVSALKNFMVLMKYREVKCPFGRYNGKSIGNELCLDSRHTCKADLYWQGTFALQKKWEKNYA